MTNLDPQPNSSERLPDGKKKIWPFREPVTIAEAVGFYVSMLVAVAGVILGGLQGSLAFIAISVMLGALSFQEYWSRIEHLGKIDAKMAQIPAAAKQAVEQGFEVAVKSLNSIEKFNSRKETYDHIAPLLLALRPKEMIIIDDAPEWRRHFSDHYRWKIHDDLMRQGAIHRRIVRVSTSEHWNAVKEMMEYEKNVDLRLGCILEDSIQMPIVQCLILDEKAVYFGQRFLGTEQQASVMIGQPEVVSLFRNYVDHLWVESKIVRDERGIHEEVKAEIERRLMEKMVRREFQGVVTYRKRAPSIESMINSLKNARESIDIVSFVDLTSADDSRNRYYTVLRETIEKNHVSHQRIIWNTDHIRWIEKMLDDGWDDLPEFTVKYYPLPSLHKIPLTTFDLVDQHTVILGQGWLTEGHITINGVEAGEYFRSYFATLWEQAEWIKRRGQPADRARLKALAEELSHGT